ncbi:trehalose 6-phosphate phosphatase [Cryobacterium mesophilum]|uniref:Trehalose 6-phosphate phosphatase n=1 Tax=Terrimesophilobacter mesophilus TaxID=433647 RepID=A0A4R8V9I8_9MICO|nr:trehalose-phosphatase [Terrimesophilobacter mesophilus]MBB5632597.1 trehalose 6-phosphate phosphatase [Terrimesophilobacter mesophilus]TFB79413.1 trehalose-phosphatase [Terrimesophilobacter mesophilus]
MSALPPALVAAIERIADVDELLVALDFDGTLAPTVDDPASARSHPDAMAAILALEDLEKTRIALVSGRSIGNLASVARLPDSTILVGSHGAEFRFGGAVSGPELDGDERKMLDRLYAAVETVAARYPGARTERKPAGSGLHTRMSSPADADAARADALAAVAALGPSSGITERYGKDILEFTVREADKGTALDVIRHRTAASAVLFVGDDVTDEDGFAVLSGHDVGVKVGPGETAASHRVADPQAVAELLALLAGLRERKAASPR